MASTMYAWNSQMETLLKNFPNVDLGGFWICCRNGTTSFGTKFTSIPNISGFNRLFNSQTISRIFCRLGCLIALYKTVLFLLIRRLAHGSCSWPTQWTMTKLCHVVTR